VKCSKERDRSIFESGQNWRGDAVERLVGSESGYVGVHVSIGCNADM